MASEFTKSVISLIRRIPTGKVMTYGQIALCCGNQRGARQVSRILHSCSKKENLPWHRVINRLGEISLDEMNGYDIQRTLLENEGVSFNERGRVDFSVYLWEP